MLDAWDRAGREMDQITEGTDLETMRQLIRRRRAAMAVLASLGEWQEQERAAAALAATTK
jgi:hypothetical protein